MRAALLLLIPLLVALGPPEDVERQYPALADPRVGLLTPLAENGTLPPLADLLRGTTPDDRARAATARRTREAIAVLARRYERTRNEDARAGILEQLAEYDDPASFQPMIEALADRDDALVVWMLDHFAAQGDAGQAALAWTAVHARRAAVRHEARRRMVAPPADAVLRVIGGGLRSPTHVVAANAATLANALRVVDAIPLLIAGQVVESTPPEEGDLAWIAIENQTVYVQRLEPVVGNNVGLYQPVLGTLTEGFVLRVQDAVVVVYRAAVHDALVALSSDDWGQPTGPLGYDRDAWWQWYRDEYLPFKAEQAERERLKG